MFTPKYYAAIEKAQRETLDQPKEALLPFNLDDLGADSWRRRAFLWLKDLLFPPIFFLLREFWPIARFGRFVIVTRAGHVCDVLRRPDVFEVPFGREMSELAGGSYFVLGVEGERHRKQNPLIRSVLLPGDADRVRELSNRFARALIRTSGGRIDVMKDFLTRVASETCIRYFGLQVDDPNAFAEWAMSVSALLFADPCGNPATRRVALNGAARLRIVIDRSIAQVQEPYPDTVLGRLLALGVPEVEIRAILVGLVTGFIPTNTLAAGKMLQELQRRPDAMNEAMRKARRAKKVDDENRKKTADDGPSVKTTHVDRAPLEGILLEAARLNPALAPGQWRYAKEEAIIAPDEERPRKVRKGSVLVVATMSALRDRRAIESPNQFRLGRKPGSAGLTFGDGTHGCLGEHLAMAQITEAFMILLSQANLRRPKWSLRWWRGIRWVGPFPRWFDMEFDPEVAPATQTMMTICAPLADSDDRRDVEREIAQLGNPATAAAKHMLDQAGIVHFASLSVIEAGDASEPAPHLLLELNVDGPVDAAIHSIVDADAANGNRLRSIFRNTPRGDEPLADVLRHYMLHLKARPWGAVGLTFNGTSEFSVMDIAKQDKLSAVAKEALQIFVQIHANIGRRAMAALRFVRDIVQRNEDSKYDDRDKVELSDFLIVPSRKRLQISDWKDRSHAQALINFAKSWAFWRLFIPMVIVTLLLGSVVFSVLTVITLIGLYGALILAVIGGLAASGLLWGLVAAGFLALLRYHESKDVPDDRNPKLADIRKIARVENQPGFVQNHFMAVTPLKSGWFRKFTLAFSMWGIGQLVINFFRPGFVLNMGTIHYAKWFRLPGRDKLIFQANYDGSWESYLEDFIMKAHAGQTAAWCNGVGFPRTKFLVQDGAQDGDRFKRWVRRQQVLAQFWYSRFSYLTTDQIRNNALIHDGLARATTDTAARAWLDCFGSMPRPDYAIETGEVQSLVFRGLRYLPHVVCALIKLPPLPSAERSRWLRSLVRAPQKSHRVARTKYSEERCGITFGDHPFTAIPELQDTATFVAFTAAGLEKLGVPGPEKPDGLATFPNTFNLGMVNRGSVLGDFGESAPETWRWTDADSAEGGAGSERAVDAAILIYATSAEECEKMLDHHMRTLGGEQILVDAIYTEPATDRIKYDEPGPRGRAKTVDRGKPEAPAEADEPDPIDFEHFGFHDGVSQPVIRGTQRFSKAAPLPRDIVEPGEFILGYRNNQDYYPPTATVSAETDPDDNLPTPLTDMPSRFPSFENSDTARDFGRNGSYLVIRQLAQDVGGFEEFIKAKAKELNDTYDDKLADVVGAPVDAKWVAAKMMGRWPDGMSLIARPAADIDDYAGKRGKSNVADADNDFSYGVDDPQGLHCPFGAHIRRANPRDSLQPEDPMQQSIINRHRLLRRGRTYEYPQKGKENEKEKGLLFTCLCADLDRQFEFVQQTWLSSPSFHGLRDEPDPISAWHDPAKDDVFTIPTPSGPVQLHKMQSFVTVRAGGYFFLPSRSAVQYLAALERTTLEKQGAAVPASPPGPAKAAVVKPEPSRRPRKARRRRQS